MVDTSAMIPLMLLQHRTNLRAFAPYAERATKFLAEKAGNPRITHAYFVDGIPHVFAIFYFRIDTAYGRGVGAWVIYGTVPPAMLPASAYRTPRRVLERYLRACDRWLAAVRAGREPEDWTLPILAPDTERPMALQSEYAEMLAKKVTYLKKRALPLFKI